MDKHQHIWVRVERRDTVRVVCEICNTSPPISKAVVRLVVQNKMVRCPYGFTDHMLTVMPDGKRVRKKQPLHDCYLDSLTPGHRCRDPENTGAGRCPHVRKLMKEHGLRTYDRVLVATRARRGVLHQEWPLNVVYAPLDDAGRTWTAVNTFTGQRHPVSLHAEQPHRRTLAGADICQEYERSVVTVNGMMVQTQKIGLPWNGVPPRDKWRCTCKNCVKGVVVARTQSKSKKPKNEQPIDKTPSSDAAPYVPALHSMWKRDEKGMVYAGPKKPTGRRFKNQKDFEDYQTKHVTPPQSAEDKALTIGEALTTRLRTIAAGNAAADKRIAAYRARPCVLSKDKTWCTAHDRPAVKKLCDIGRDNKRKKLKKKK